MNLISKITPFRLRLAVVALPMLVGILYFTVIASPRYVSEAIISVHQASQETSAGPLAMMLTGGNSTSRDDTLYVRQYIQSVDLLTRLDKKLNLRKHFEEGSGLDLPFRLSKNANREDFVDFFRRIVELKFDEAGTLLTIRTQGFTAAFSKQFNDAILVECERFVNDFSQRIGKEQTVFAETEFKGTVIRFQAAKQKLLAFQTRHQLLDPVAQAQATGVLVSDLQASLTKSDGDIKAAQGFLQDDSYQVKTLRTQNDAIRSQLAIEKLRTTGGPKLDRINMIASQYQDLTMHALFTQDAYKLALTAVESARIDALRKVKSLVVIEAPTMPDSALYPRRLYYIGTLLVICGFFYVVARTVVETIRSHQD